MDYIELDFNEDYEYEIVNIKLVPFLESQFKQKV